MPQVKVGWRSGSVSPVVSVSKLLDTYSSSAAAYSLRKLSSTYTGSAIRVRRSSDNTEQNIGFDSDGNLDTVALSAFVGSGSGFVTTWYDQSGNSRNVAQTTAANQPRIVNTGAIELLNGKVCFSNYGQNQWLQLNSFGSNIASIFSFAMVGSVGNDSFRVALKFNPPSTGNNSKLQVNGFASLTSLEMQGSSSIYYSFPGVMNTTIPHIIQGTFNSTTSEFSVNNQTLLTGNAGPSTLNGIIIGADWNGAYPTSGKYQEVVVWGVNKSTDRSGINTALNTYYSVYPNPTSVWNLLNAVYNADTTALSSLKTSLVASYNGESNANDSFGSNNGTAQGGLTYGTGKIGNAFNFNGTTSYINIPNVSDQFNFANDFSISLWFNPMNTTSQYQVLFTNKSATSTNGGYVFYYERGSINKLRFEIQNGSNFSTFESSFLPSANTWYHLTITRKKSTTTKMYINGSIVSGSYNYLGGSSNIDPLYQTGQIYSIGSYGTTILSAFAEDAINVWSKELTQSEITELYNSGNGAQYIGDSFYKPTTNDALNTYNGTAQGGLTYGVGKVGTAFQFNGTNSYILLPRNTLRFTNSFSVSLWVYSTANQTGNKGLFSDYYYPGDLGYTAYVTTQNKIEVFFKGSYATNNSFTSNSSLSNNQWNNIVISWDKTNTQWKIYINGVLDYTYTNGNAGVIQYQSDAYENRTNIGAINSSSSFAGSIFNGSIDAFNVWNKVLTQSEITELYNSGNGKQYPN